MSRDNEPLSVGESVWDDDPYVHVMKLVERAGKVLGDIAASGHAPDENAGRVAELERQLAEARQKLAAYSGQIAELGRQLAERTKHYEDQVADRNELERKLTDALYNAESFRAQAEGASRAHAAALELLTSAYVTREVPWSDVAAGMMTIARDGTPWMVIGVGDGAWTLTGLHAQQVIRFEKTPTKGETVRVLVPYVTPEQAESLVKGELGGTAVS